MGFDDRLWTHLVEHHDAHLAESPARPAPRHPAARRGTAAGAVALAAAAAGVVVLDQPSRESAWAQQALQRAAAVVIPPSSPDTILHVAATETLSPLARRDSKTTVASLSEEAWIQQGRPWNVRAILQVPGGHILEADNTGQVYDRSANTVLPAPAIPHGKPQYTLTPIEGGRYRLTARLPSGRASAPEILNASTARALRDGTEVVQWTVSWDDHAQVQRLEPTVLPSNRQLAQTQAQQPSPGSASFAAELRALLDSGHARVTRTTTADGRPAIEISSVHPQSGPPTDYYVDPHTYQPIELDIYGFDSRDDVSRLRITRWETLPLAGHEQLVHVDVPPTAEVDRTPAHYWQAVELPRPF